MSTVFKWKQIYEPKKLFESDLNWKIFWWFHSDLKWEIFKWFIWWVPEKLLHENPNGMFIDVIWLTTKIKSEIFKWFSPKSTKQPNAISAKDKIGKEFVWFIW